MKAVATVRKALKIRTAFNILGPLLNPAAAQYALVGVYSPAIIPTMADVLKRLGVLKVIMPECSPGAADELSCVRSSVSNSLICVPILAAPWLFQGCASRTNIHMLAGPYCALARPGRADTNGPRRRGGGHRQFLTQLQVL